MSELPFRIRQAINKYEPIEIDGLWFYPIRVEEFEAFQAARPGIEVMQQALPLPLVSLPLLAALYKLDYDATVNGRQPSGLFFSAVLFLAISLRLGDGLEAEKRTKMFRIVVDEHDPSRLKCLRVLLRGEELHDITPVQFSRYRPILAAQNGIDLEPDDANPELVQAERDIAAQNTPQLDVSIEAMISGVCALSGAEEADVYRWPILKLTRRREALNRAIDYIVCGINEGAGCKWKGGNPVPSVWFQKKRETSAALMPLGDFANGAGARAVSNPGQNVT